MYNLYVLSKQRYSDAKNTWHTFYIIYSPSFKSYIFVLLPSLIYGIQVFILLQLISPAFSTCLSVLLVSLGNKNSFHRLVEVHGVLNVVGAF